MKYIIYALTEPDTDQVRYIGRTQDLPRRISEHLNNSRGCALVQSWVLSLKERGTLPSWKVLEETNNWAREKYWKDKFTSQRCSLLNQQTGGKRQYVRTPEMLAAMRAPHAGTKMSQELKDKMAEGRKKSPIWKAMVSKGAPRWPTRNIQNV